MVHTSISFVVALKTLTLVLGGVITFFAYRAYRRSQARPLGLLALGFGIVTVGALVAGLAHQGFGMNLPLVVTIESALTVVGFAIIVVSMYID